MDTKSTLGNFRGTHHKIKIFRPCDAIADSKSYDSHRMACQLHDDDAVL